MHKHHGFTLIELLVVMAIIATISSLMFALIGVVGTSQDRRDTEFAIMTIGSSIDIFMSDTGAVPAATGSAVDVQSGTWYPSTPDGSWEKQQLYWRLAHVMTKEEKADAETNAKAADILADPYQDEAYVRAVHSGDVKAGKQTVLGTIPNADVEIYRGNMSQDSWDSNGAGDVPAWFQLTKRGWTKAYVLNIRGALAYDAEKRKYLTFATLDENDLPDGSFIDGDRLLDAWGNPLIYIAESTPAIEYRYPPSTSRSSGNYPVGKPASGRIEMTDRNGDGLVNELDWPVAPPVGTGDIEDQLDHQIDHNGDSAINEADWSNVMYYARLGNGLGYFLASAGEDGLFNCLWADEANSDNIVNSLTKD